MKFVAWMNSPAGRAARVVAGLGLIVAGFAVGGTAGVALAVVGVVPVAAGAFGVCLLAPLMHQPARTR